MSEPFSHWLALREPHDAAARSTALTQMLIDRLAPDRPLEILDLGTGAGSNVRYLAPRLPPRQHWLLLDYDAELLAIAPQRFGEWAAGQGYSTRADPDGLLVEGGELACRVEWKAVDLRTLDPALFAGRALITGSALLDLVSDRWLQQLAHACAASQSAVLFALSYSGEVTCAPGEADDRPVIARFNQHQRGDKGFGPAVGPEAASRAALAFEQVGYVVHRQRSDWVLDADASELQRRLLAGWHAAAAAIAPDESARLHEWLERRLEHLRAGRSQIRVSHEDLAAFPAIN